MIAPSITLTPELLLIILWELVWKGLALYRAAKRNEKVWFILLLILNTIGIFPIIYLLATQNSSKKKETKKKK